MFISPGTSRVRCNFSFCNIARKNRETIFYVLTTIRLWKLHFSKMIEEKSLGGRFEIEFQFEKIYGRKERSW